MDQQNIDRLFREKLDQMEVTPSSKSWSQVEKQIRPKKTPVLYWVAASISLLIMSWFVWSDRPSQTETFNPIASEVNHPLPSRTPEFIVPVVKAEDKKPVIKKSPEPRKESTIQPQFAENSEKATNEDKLEELPILEVESKTMVATEDVEKPEILENVKESINKPEFRTVKITYIASSNNNSVQANTEKTDSTGVLKKFIAFAEKIDPGDVLADIKTAKDNLLNGGLKNKKDRNSL
ncbi:hypothetical protein [Ekhidna sp.]|uniref:hypothetical protein n=1 Tax=Ekhidna sp. TaxID=2608089 RepID=UPI003B50048D